MRRVRLVCAVVATLAALALAGPAAAASSPRVVALEWDGVEDALALGVTPVGGADLRGYRAFVSPTIPSSVQDVGTRQEPSLERIAQLKPDVIVVPSYRAGKNLGTLRKLAKRVVVTNPYPPGAR